MIDEDELTDKEVWEAMDQRSKEKRAYNREQSPKVLTEAGLVFSTHNNGAHLVVVHESKEADFWPGTGRWFIRVRKKWGFGVFNLIKQLKGVK